MFAAFEAPAILIGLSALSGWIAWRYSRLPVSQDEGLWMLWGVTGAKPYIDHVDCKPPGIHLWCYALAHVTGRNPYMCRFLHQLGIGAFGVIEFCISGDANSALCFLLLTRSAWLEGYYAWVEAIASGFWFLAFYLAPGPATGCLALACLFNLKLAAPCLVFALARGWFDELAIALSLLAVAVCVLRMLSPGLARALWYGCIMVPKRLVELRKREGQSVLRLDRRFMAPLLLVLPLAVSGAIHGPDPGAWAAGAAYVGLNALGRVWRPYHWIALAPVIATAAPPITLLVLLGDLASNGFYLGDIIARHRPAAVSGYLKAAEKIGNKLGREFHRLWVYGEFTQLYVYARSRPAVLPVEQVEIRWVIPERRFDHVRTINDVDTLVICPGEMRFVPNGFRVEVNQDSFLVLVREGRVPHECDADPNSGRRLQPGAPDEARASHQELEAKVDASLVRHTSPQARPARSYRTFEL